MNRTFRSNSVVTRTYADRNGKCYSICVDFILDNPDSIVVHGLGFGGPGDGGMHPHSWIQLPDGSTYEPILDRFFPPDAQMTRVEHARYTLMDVCDLIVTTDHCGPWHE